MVRTKEEVLKLFGRPDDTQEVGNPGDELFLDMWYYRNLTFDPITKSVDFHVQLMFKNGRVSIVNF